MRRADRPLPGVHKIAQGEAELLRDADRDSGWLILIDGVPQSYIDLDDPTHLDFEYMRLLGDVVDHLGVGDEPLDVVHIGGAGCTLARYIAATRPDSRQIVFDLDAPLIQLVRDNFPVKHIRGLKIKIADGRQGLSTLPDASDDLIVLDAFSGAVMPLPLATVEFTQDVARVLRDDGVYLVNVADGARLPFARRLAATLQQVFPHTLLMAEPPLLRGRRYGNLILAASHTPLPTQSLTRITSSKPIPARCLDTEALSRFTSGHPPIHDNDQVPLPTPPKSLFT
ncbi:fused MFS/spermidine synthase [Actinocorallia sp. A-T 12471]|uniref:spermidine synthase n=1 Tax=Actinocorallia sp. A-T 12471 TaxID=3089813 RepID=UPI0029CE1BC4|nr:fused MFS/spermidine synthase [Actinocorallia sp. A-T 12471]MDX6743576.1 fused MFS/spermidine synthase [Actinocorallia sp. A-T 12471]